MRISIDHDRFLAQVERFKLRFCCEDCAYFLRSSQTCAHGWPNAEHQRRHYQQQQDSVLYCKEFELA